ncbi:Tetratricopeptide repeat-like superfamily protein, partial [Prunus dulcis]
TSSSRVNDSRERNSTAQNCSYLAHTWKAQITQNPSLSLSSLSQNPNFRGPMALQQFGRTKSVTKRSTKYVEQALYLRLFKDGGSDVSVRQQLNEVLKSRKRVYKWEVGDTLKKLRERKLYYPALKLSEVMDRRGMNKTVSDQAIHLDLIAKTRDIPAAENYFIDLPETAKTHHSYGALLNCYCKELMTEKAEALMEKMKALNLSLTSMPYNSLMTLYSKTGHPEKIPAIIQEMKAGSVMLDSCSYNVWMRALLLSMIFLG